jgi:hypothetical protein
MSIIGDREPWGSRESVVIGALPQLFMLPDVGLAQLNSQHTTMCGGVALSDRFVSYLELKDAIARALTYNQRIVLFRRYVKGDTRRDTAKALRLRYNTVALDEFEGLQALVRLLWGDPAYESPPRMRRLASV